MGRGERKALVMLRFESEGIQTAWTNQDRLIKTYQMGRRVVLVPHVLKDSKQKTNMWK